MHSKQQLTSGAQSKQTEMWLTGDGTKIRICDMTAKHLQNAIQYLWRWAEREREAALDLAQEVDNFVSADIASYYADQELTRACIATREDYLPSIYWKLVNDRERRKEKMEKEVHRSQCKLAQKKDSLNVSTQTIKAFFGKRSSKDKLDNPIFSSFISYKNLSCSQSKKEI